MPEYKEYFKGKRITLMGLGLLGRGVGDAQFLAECGAELIVTDLKSEDKLKPSIKKLQKYKNIIYHLGAHRLEDFRNRDLIIKAAGVPQDSIYIVEARKRNIPIEMDASLFVKFFGGTVIGITGTRGKSTTTQLIYHIIKTAKLPVYLGGNVQGLATLPLLKKIKPKDIVVLELDSWQLQGFGDAKISPNIAVFTTFFPDHMNYYKNSMESYFTDKANIFRFQKKDALLIAGKQAYPFIQKWGRKITSSVIVPKPLLPRGFTLTIPGEHNVYNATLAIAVAKNLNIKDVVIKKALKTFKGVPGRLELVREVRGVKIYNDTTATTPEAALAALKTLGTNKKNVVLITGGTDKLLDMRAYLKEISKVCKAVLLLSGSGTERIRKDVKAPIVTEYTNFKKAVQDGFALAKRGDILLLSPAFTSFGMFNNEYHRGEQFNATVKKLK